MRHLVALSAILILAGCGTNSSSSTPSSPSPATRPSSPVRITLVSPTNGEIIHGNVVHVVVAISGGQIVKTASTQISPTQGHVHLFLDKQLIYMAYTLSQDIPVTPGLTYSMGTEFVASDHIPFSPRDTTPTIVFSVAPQ